MKGSKLTAMQLAARTSRDAIGFGERSVDLLRLIEHTVNGLCADRAMMAGLANAAGDVARKVATMERVTLLDPNDAVQETLLKGRDAIAKARDIWVDARNSVRRDPEVSDEDGLEDEFTTAIAAACDLHNALNTLLWSIGEHDADLESPSGISYTDVSQLLKAMTK